ncbi:transcription elongation factor SPT4 [Flavobacterium facile]|uniref:hypothetical protein n=1 Tax=Flavobacterium facile TaxID=2893174 RepID=UPI002E7914B9|nr:hypothetical protein [Flavobacterium sp. T-12]
MKSNQNGLFVILGAVLLFASMFFIYDYLMNQEETTVVDPKVENNEATVENNDSFDNNELLEKQKPKVIEVVNNKNEIVKSNKSTIVVMPSTPKTISVSSLFNEYSEKKSNELKTKFFVKEILPNYTKCSSSELKEMASNIYDDLSNNFPDKSEVARYAIICSKQDSIITFLNKYGFNTSQIQTKFTEKCP